MAGKNWADWGEASFAFTPVHEPMASTIHNSSDGESAYRLGMLPTGQVQTFLCASVSQGLDQLTSIEAAVDAGPRTVVHLWPTLPEPNVAIAEIVRTLANVAYQLWPYWYQQEAFIAADVATAEQKLLNLFACQDLQLHHEICLPWLKASISACQRHRAPLLPSFSHALQLSQLALAIDPDGLVLAVAVEDHSPPPHRLLGAARSVRWIAEQIPIRVALLVPQELADAAALDSVRYGAALLAAVQQPLVSSDVEAKHTVFPIYGRPHPFSPGEQTLAIRLTKDAELAGLFRFNQTVKTVRHSQYLVDLLWTEGHVIIEVDGYRHHGNEFGFRRDRHRDYELLISGYVVLRLPHDEVVSDIEIAVEKIRDVVKFRRHQLFNSSEVSP